MTLTKVKVLQDGTGGSLRTIDSKFNDFVSVKDFGAVGDGSTDDTTAFQNAINTGKPVYVPKPPDAYKITDTLTLNSSYKALIGDECMPVIEMHTDNKPAIEIVATSSGTNEYSRVENLYIKRLPNDNVSAVPNYSATITASLAGVVVSGNASSVEAAVQYTRISNLRVGNFAVGYYFADCVGVTVHKSWAQNLTNHSSATHTANNTAISSSMFGVGFYFEATRHGTGISPLASIEIVECDDNREQSPTAIKTVSYYIKGEDIRDIFFQRAESTKADYGWYIETPSASPADLNWDVHIIRPIVDQFGVNGIFATNLDGVGALTITGGYFVGSSSSQAAIYASNSNGISISGGTQILGIDNNTANDKGVELVSCSSCSIVGNRFGNCRFGIVFNNTTFSTIVGNIFSAASTESESAPTLTVAIDLNGTSTDNTIVDNTIRGLSASNEYAAGIAIASTASNTRMIGNTIDSATVTDNIVDRSTSSITGQSAFKNRVMNGNINIWQRATTISSTTNAYTADRWKVSSNASNISVNLVDDNTSLLALGSRNAARVKATSNAPSFIQWGQQIEYNNCWDLQNKKVTISFLAKALADTDSSKQLKVRTRTQNTSEGTATLFAASNSDTTLTLSTSFTKHVVTRSLGSFKGLSLEFVLDHSSLGTNDGFEITQIQLEEGDGSQFEHLNISEELSQCQRYCYVWKSSQAYSNMGTGYMTDSTNVDFVFNLPQIMRASPSFSSSGSFRIVGYEGSDQNAQGISSLAMTRSHPHTPYIRGVISGGLRGAVGEFGDNGSNNATATFEADF